MFGLGIWEIAAIAVVALIVIRPKDLPVVVRNLGRLYHKAMELYRGIAETLENTERQINREIELARDDVLRESESETQLPSAREPDSPYAGEQATNAATEDPGSEGLAAAKDPEQQEDGREVQKCSEQQKS